MKFPLVRDLAAEGFPVTVTCGVLGFSTQAFYKWQARPCSDRDWADADTTNTIVDVHADDPEFGYRFIADELERAGHATNERRGVAAVSRAPGLVDDHEEGPQERQGRRPGQAKALNTGTSDQPLPDPTTTLRPLDEPCSHVPANSHLTQTGFVLVRMRTPTCQYGASR